MPYEWWQTVVVYRIYLRRFKDLDRDDGLVDRLALRPREGTILRLRS